MKSKIKIVLFCFIFLIIVSCIILILTTQMTKINMSSQGKIIYIYDFYNINSDLMDEDIHEITKMFNNKIMYMDNPSCGFSKNISIKLNDSEYFCLARDSCHIVYWENKNRYFKLSSSEYTLLMTILSKYGAVFPCV